MRIQKLLPEIKSEIGGESNAIAEEVEEVEEEGKEEARKESKGVAAIDGKPTDRLEEEEEESHMPIKEGGEGKKESRSKDWKMRRNRKATCQ